jgi:hypothetical protein
VSTDDPVDQGVSNSILDLDAVNDGRGDEELILDVDKVIRQLNG